MNIQIVLNKNNLINKNKFEYVFPRDFNFEENDKIALKNLNLYFSWFNINQKKYNNSKFYYLWWDMNGELTVMNEIVFQDGYYTLNDLNEYIISQFIKKGHYLETTDGLNYIFLIELKSNSVFYSAEFKLESVSETIFNIGHKQPTEWKKPTDLQTAQIYFPNNSNFNEMVGFKPGSYFQDLTIQPTTNQSYSFLSNITPNMEPSSSFIITSNMISNKYSHPSNILTSFTINNDITFGSMINITGTDVIYSNIVPGNYRSIILEIFDQEYRELDMLDPNVLIVLSIIKNSEN